MTARRIIWGTLGVVVLLFIVGGWWLCASADRDRKETARINDCAKALREAEYAVRDGKPEVLSSSLASARVNCGPEKKAQIDALAAKTATVRAAASAAADALAIERASVLAGVNGEWAAYDAGPKNKAELRRAFQGAVLRMIGCSPALERELIEHNGAAYRKRAIALGLTGNAQVDGM